MALETASYVANLVQTNPDGSDARSTADDHLRLIKAALKRTFPNLDAAVSLSAAQIAYLNDVSASVQAQLNALRDGSATVNNAIRANSASFATNAASAANATHLGSISALAYARRDVTISFAAGMRITAILRPLSVIPSAVTTSWYALSVRDVSMTEAWRLVYTPASGNLDFVRTRPTGSFLVNGTAASVAGHEHSAGAITSGTLENARVSFNNVSQHAGSLSVAVAGFANSASSAALLAGFSPSTTNTGSTVAVRNSSGDVFVRYINSSATPSSSLSVGHIFCMTASDGYARPTTVAQVGEYMEARNITGRSGTRKTLANGSGPPSLTGSTNGDIFYYY